MMNTLLVESGTDAGRSSRVWRSTGLAWLTLMGVLIASPGWALPIDLRDFSFYDGDPVMLGSTDGTAAGSFASIGEDALFFSIPLYNDPGLGDPVLINPSEGPVLRFDYDFASDSAADCADTFSCDGLLVTLFDADPLTGGVIGGFLTEFFIDATSSGQVSFLLSAFSGVVFGLQFELLSYDFDDTIGSSALISGLEVFDPNAPPPVDPPVGVPEPGSLALLAAGLAGLLLRRRNRRV